MSQVNFIITEGDEFYNKHKNKFIELYTNGASNKEIIEQLNITRTQCNTFRRRLHCEGKITDYDFQNRLNTIRKNNSKYYYYDKRTKLFIVRKGGRHYTSFKKEEQAIQYVELMHSINWDYSRRWEIREKILY